MNLKSFLTVFLLGGLVGGFGVYFLKAPQSFESASLGPKQSSTQNNVARERVEAKITEAPLNQPSSDKKPNRGLKDSEEGAQKTKDTEVDYEERAKIIHSQVDEMVSRANETGKFDLSNQASNQFEQSQRDELWADEHERKLHDLFATDEDLQGAFIQSVECKSEQCRVQIYYDNKGQAGNISDRLARIFGSSDQYGFAPAISMFFDENSNLANIFLSDDVTKVNPLLSDLEQNTEK